MKKFKLFLASAAMLLGCALASAQTVTVHGTVTDASTGESIPAASVVIKGTLSGVTADVQGRWSLSVPSDAILVFSTVGFKTAEVSVSGKTVIDVALHPDAEFLNETIVVAFGRSTKEAFTGSAAVVKTEDITKVQASNVSSALVGRVAGLQTSSSSGDLSAGVSIRVRGFGSFNASQSPLWVVDGMPYEGDLNNLNPGDIESITVLKDASANALYGARGANGVILVTTKRAQAGVAKVTFDAKWGVNTKALKSYDVITDPGEYYETYFKTLYNYAKSVGGLSDEDANAYANQRLTGNVSGGLGYNVYTVPEGQNLIGLDGKLNPDATLGRKVVYQGQEYLLYPDNWEQEGFKNGLRQEYNLSVSGASDKFNFFGSFGYLNNQGIIRGSSMDRYTARMKSEYQIKDWLRIGGNVNYAHFTHSNGNSSEGSSTSTANIFAYTSQVAPIYPLYIRDGQGNIMVDANGYQMYDYGNAQYGQGGNAGMTRPFISDANPLQVSWLDKNINEGNAFGISGFADIDILKDLKLTINGSTNIDETRSTNLANPYYGQFAEGGGSIYKYHTRDWAYNLQQLLNYEHTFAHDHTVSLLLGHEYYRDKYYYLQGAHSKLFSYDNDELASGILDARNSYSYVTDYNTEGFFLRAQYDYAGRVFVSGSFRRDASSNFHPDHRWGNFWSVGGAWLISKEPWFHSSWVDMLKVKASYGQQGNDQIGSLRYTDIYEIVDDGQGNIATVFDSKGNPDITWETNSNLNAGVEFGFWRNRLSGGLEFFSRETSDMLFWFTVPQSMGYSGYYSNIGNIVNRGIELELSGDIIRTRNVTWSASFNLTHVKNKVTKLADEYKTQNIDGYPGYIDGSYYYAEGLPMYSFYLRKFAGVDHETGESLWYKDVTDADGNVTGTETTSTYSEATVYNTFKSSMPDFYGGFSTSISAFGFDASVTFAYQVGGWVYDSGYANFMGSPYSTSTHVGYNIHRDILNAWSEDNKDSNIPRFQYGDQYNVSSSDRFLTKASYLNIQNINVGYTFPRKWTSKIGIDQLRFYLACDNVAYWSARQGLDPRYSFSGSTNYANYSPIRTISGGLNIVF